MNKLLIVLITLLQIIEGRCLPRAKNILGRRVFNEINNVCIPDEYLFEYPVIEKKLFV